MRKILTFLLILSAVLSAAPVDNAGDVILTAPYEESPDGATITADGFIVGTKESGEVIRDLWVGGDLNQNGLSEVILASYKGGGKAYVYEISDNNTATLLCESDEFGSSSSGPVRDAKFGDLDGNGNKELIVNVNSTDPDIGGLWIYEYDTSGDSLLDGYHIAIDDISGNRWYSESMLVYDVDQDGVQELLVGNNGTGDFDKVYIGSITSGTFSNEDAVWTLEYEHGKTSAELPFGGSAYGPTVGDMDGDGNLEALFSIWDNGALFIVESDAADTYTHHAYIETDLDVNDDFAFYDFVTADLDENGRDEVYVSMYSGGALYSITCPEGTDLSALSTSNVHKIDALGSSGGVCTQIGDWDLDSKMEIYASGGGSYITSHEYQGGDPTSTDSWVKDSTIYNSSFSGVYGMRYAGDLDGDGLPEIYGANTGSTSDAVIAIETSINSLFISEVADPSNEYSARFFELHNNSSQDIDFSTGWKINYYANDNTSPSVINLTGTLESDSTFIIANNAANFESIFGFAPDMSSGTFNSNGDDNMELVDPNDNVIDVFGVPGEDGSGTDHEFSDGRAVRKASVSRGNSTYDASEWTILLDVDAPGGFDPGVWPTVLPLDFVKAYPSSSTEITIDYNIEVASADPADYTLLGTSGVTFTSADIDPTDATIVTLTAGTEITADLVLDTLIDAANEDTAEFYAGLTPIAMTNVTNTGGYIENGHTALFHGIVSANDAYNNVWISDDATGEYSGVMIFDYGFDSDVNVGDEIKFTAERTEYNNLTELENPMLLSTVSTGNEPYGPFDITGTDIDSSLAADTDPGEKWEGQLVKISGAEVVSYSDYYYVCTDDGGTTHFLVGDNVDYQFGNISMSIGETYDIIGVVDYDGDYYRVNPRGMDDIIPEIVDNDLNLTFEDDSDVANWDLYGESSGYTTVAHDASGGVGGTGGLKFTDGGYALVMKRPVSATMGTTYHLSLDVKVANWATDDTLAVTVEGLSSEPDSVDIHSYTDFTTIEITGQADTSGSGYIKLVGNYGGTGSLEVYFDNLVWDDNATLPDTTSPTIVEATGINDTTVVVTYSEVVDSSSAANVANYSIDKEIGSPLSATVEENMATLIVDTLEADTAYTLTVNDVADTSGNIIAANSTIEFMWEPWTPGPDLFISEYIEGSSNNKALELYNPTDTVLDLSEYAIITGSSGGGFWYDPEPLHGMLPAGETYVIINPEFDFSLIDSAAVVDSLWGKYVTWFNGNDPRAVGKLLSGSWTDTDPNFVVIDAIGDISEDPGTAWDVAGVSEATAEHTLIRKPEIVMGNTDWTASAGTDETNSEWVVMNQNTVQFLGSHPHMDLSGPEIAQVVAINETTIQVNFNEAVDSTSAATASNYDISTIGEPSSIEVPYESVAILTVSGLVDKSNYVLTVNNITDLAGLTIEENSEFHFKYEIPYLMAWDRIINDFESDVGNWTDPNFSGSTYGVTDASSFKSSGDYAFRNSKSGKMSIIDDPGRSDGWFVRDWNLNRVDQVHADSKLMMYVRGHDHDVKIRFVIRDDGSGGDDGYEAGPWHHVTVAEDDWQLVSLDLLNDPVTGWITGDGNIASSDKVSIDCIQIACDSDKDVDLYFDPIFERYNNNPPARFTLIEPADGATITNEDLVQDSLFQVMWHAAIEPDPSDSIDHYKLRALDADNDTLIYEASLPDTSNLLPVSSEDNGTFKWCVQAYDTKGAYSVSDTFTVTFDIEVGVEEENALPRVFALHHNYPNPFNPTTTVKYDLPEPSNEVTLRVFNLLGNVVKEVKRQNVKAGYHKFLLDCSDLSSGVYFYQIRAGNFIATKKMTLLK